MAASTPLRVPHLAMLAVLVLLCASVVDAFGASHTELYADLGVATSADKAQIRQAFRRLTREHHPDLHDGYDEKEQAKARMAKILRAYEVLSDEVKRADYDAAGIIPGEALNPRDVNMAEMFAHFHQTAPIPSKTPTLESLTMLRRLREFRGARLFFIQVYDDRCGECRLFASAWETLFHSSLVDAGVLKMFRIDGTSPEGVLLLKELELTYRSSPLLMMMMDGEVWTYNGVGEVTKAKSDKIAFSSMLDFTMSFFYDVYATLNALEAPQVEDVMAYLRAPRSSTASSSTSSLSSAPIRVLLPHLDAESLPISLQLRYGSLVEVRVVGRDVLQPLVESTCRMKMGVRNRAGEEIAMPEFLLVSTQPMPSEEEEPEDDDDDDDDDNDDDQKTKEPSPRCRNIHVGASLSLNYEKASTFLNTHLPPTHVGMEGLQHITSMSFFDVCEHNCLLWLRPSCSAVEVEVEKKLADVLRHNFLSFKTGYVCLNEETKWHTWAAGHVATRGGALPTFVALMDGDDSQPIHLDGLQHLEVKTKDVDAVLADLVDYRGQLNDCPKVRVVVTQPALATRLISTNFPISMTQRYYILSSTYLDVMLPTLKSVAPFFLMFLVHRFVLNRNKAGPNDAVIPTSSYIPPPIRSFSMEDLNEAKKGRGFLILVYKERLDGGGGAASLPNISLDPRLAVRFVGPQDHRLKAWLIRMQKKRAAAMSGGGDDVGASTTSSATTEASANVPDGERDLSVVAIRMKAMKAILKEETQSIEAFLRDILDGTKAPNEDLPAWALQ